MGAGEHDPIHETRMPHRDLDGDLGAHRVADEGHIGVCPLGQQSGDDVGVALDREGSGRLGRLAVPGQVDGDHPTVGDEMAGQVGEDAAAHPDAVDEDERPRP